MAKINHLAITGLPSSGKSEIAGYFKRNSGYVHLSTDKVRTELYGNEEPWKLNHHMWQFIYSVLQVDKHMEIIQRRNVVTDGCPFSVDLKKLIMYTHPHLRDILEEAGYELERYLVKLDVDFDEILKRNKNRGRESEIDSSYLEMIRDEWEHIDKMEDEYGPVNVLVYPNNTREDQRSLIRSLELKLNI